MNWYDHYARYFDPEVGRWWAIAPALQGASPCMEMGNNPMMYTDADGRTWGIFKAIGQAWDYAWDKGNQFAQWADKNGIPSFNVGVGMNSGGQVNPMVNGQNINENNSINQGVANAGNSLTSQLANLPIDNSSYRPLNRGWIPSVYVDPAIFNGVLSGEYNFHNYTLDRIIYGMKGSVAYSEEPEYAITKFQQNDWAELRNDKGVLGKASYLVADEINIVGQRIILQKLPSQITHLDRSGVTRNEIVDAGIGAMTNYIPITRIGGQLKIAKTTFNAGFFNKFYKGTGIYSSKKGGMYLRQLNNSTNQNIGSKRIFSYFGYGGYSPYLFKDIEK